MTDKIRRKETDSSCINQDDFGSEINRKGKNTRENEKQYKD